MWVIQGFDRNQFQMSAFDQVVKQDSWARIVDVFVDILHYQKIIVALSETDRIMKEIDKIEIE